MDAAADPFDRQVRNLTAQTGLERNDLRTLDALEQRQERRKASRNREIDRCPAFYDKEEELLVDDLCLKSLYRGRAGTRNSETNPTREPAATPEDPDLRPLIPANSHRPASGAPGVCPYIFRATSRTTGALVLSPHSGCATRSS